MAYTPPQPPSFVWGHLFGNTKLPTTLLTGRTVIVTGSNQGLGLLAAHQLAALSPALLILAVRDTAKGDIAARGIEAQGFKGEIQVWALDLASFASAREFAKRCEGLARLDCVVENAGVSLPTWSTTGDGWETTLQVNCLATGLLGLFVLPILAKTAALPSPVADSTYVPHLTIVGSEVHNWAAFAEKDISGRPTLEVLDDKETSEKFISDRYFTSKLIVLYIARQLALLPLAKNVIVNCVNPGMCRSGLIREFPGIIQFIAYYISWTTEKGARSISWAAADCATSGSYVAFSQEMGTSKFSTSKEGLELERKLWDEMSTVWSGLAPEVTPILQG